MREPRYAVLFAVAWAAEATLMAVSAVGALGASVLFGVLSVGSRQPVPAEWQPYLVVYPFGAACQLALAVYALTGAVSTLRLRGSGPTRLRRASGLLLAFLAVTWVAVLAFLLALVGWQDPFVAMAALVLVGSGIMLSVLPAATLKWLPGTSDINHGSAPAER